MIAYKLRQWTFDDLESVSRHADNPKITRFMSDGFPISRDQWKLFLEHVVQNKSLHYQAIEIDGEAVGGIGISPKTDILRNNAELGYWLSENYWGKGIMVRAVEEITKTAFDTLPINRIFATPFGNNIASQRLLEKCGFHLEARFEKIILKNGELLDELVYASRRKDCSSDR